MTNIRQSAHSLALLRSGETAPLLVQHAPPDARPYIHPLRAPDGRGVLTEDRPPHHAWQHGLYIGLNDVNGFGFWTEGLYPGHRPIDGTFHPRLEAQGTNWTVETEYRAPTGQALLDETQRWTFHDAGMTYSLDLVWTLRARCDLRFGRYDYGGLFLRMPVQADTPARILNSAGATTLAGIEQQRADWLALAIVLPDRGDWAGLAMLDHPSNPGHPLPWRADSQYGIGPSPSSAGSWTLANGAAVTYRHRVFVFTGQPDFATIAAQYQEYK